MALPRQVSSSADLKLLDTPLHRSHSLIRNLLTDGNVASVCNSSSHATNAICNLINFSSALVVVEYGPGSGAITVPVLKHLPADGQIIALETNLNLAEGLSYDINDRRLRVIHGTAELVDKFVPRMTADVVISGIPFSMMSDQAVENILHKTRMILKPGGRFIVYQAWLPPFFTTDRLQRLLAKHFEILSVTKVLRNIPPLQLFTCGATGK